MKLITNLNSHNNLKIKSAHKVLFPLSAFSDTRNLAKNRKIIQIQFSLPENKKDNTSSKLGEPPQNPSKLGEPPQNPPKLVRQNAYCSY